MSKLFRTGGGFLNGVAGTITGVRVFSEASKNGDFQKLMSIKCRQPSAHLDFLKSGAVPADSLAQMRHELWIAGALEHDYFSWNPDFPEALQSRIVTVTASEADIPGYEREALAFCAEVDGPGLHVRRGEFLTAYRQARRTTAGPKRLQGLCELAGRYAVDRSVEGIVALRLVGSAPQKLLTD